MQHNAVIVGAGFAGAVVARQLADDGLHVLVLERRNHIGGNAYDCLDPSGVLIHKYGPHIFHTNNKQVYDYISRFTDWHEYSHKVVASIPTAFGGRSEFPLPFNLTSLEITFGSVLGPRLAQKLVDTYGPESKITILDLQKSRDPEIVALARYIYEHVFVHYTVKQWGQPPEEIDPNTTARVPVFLSRDDRYFQDTYQGIPAKGYTALFKALLDHPNIEVQLNTDALDRLAFSDGTVLLDGNSFKGPVIYTGAADELFGCIYGRLPYRTLDFKFETHPVDQFQSHGTVNYTVDKDYTRITEFKHMTGQHLSEVTTTVKEYPRTYTGDRGEIPYYAVINAESNTLYARYAESASQYGTLYLLGRLAEYKYYNMDTIVDRALALSEQIKRNLK